jgi:hypothetical protein
MINILTSVRRRCFRPVTLLPLIVRSSNRRTPAQFLLTVDLDRVPDA